MGRRLVGIRATLGATFPVGIKKMAAAMAGLAQFRLAIWAILPLTIHRTTALVAGGRLFDLSQQRLFLQGPIILLGQGVLGAAAADKAGCQ